VPAKTWVAAGSKLLVKDLSDKRHLRAAFQRLRMTWILVVASVVPLYAIPVKLQAMYEATRGSPYC